MASLVPTPHTRSYDPNIIIRAAHDKLTTGDLAGGQTLFQSALLNWVDDAREGSTMDADSLKEAIATLWVAYAQFLMNAKQYKSATEAFEQAIECPIGSTVGRVWLEYARFLEERNKLRTAQQVYLRALVTPQSNGMAGAVQDEQDQNLLWNEFLELSRTTTDNPDLTLKELKQAIQEEHTEEPVLKRPRLHEAMKHEVEDEEEQEDGPKIRTYVVTPTDVEFEIETLTEAIHNVPNDPTFMAAWLIRDGDAPPQPPIPLFEAAPPKLSDPTGRELLGEDLALAVVSRLLEPSGSVVLQVCQGLWMWTLLKEQQAQKLRRRMDDSLTEEYRQLQARLEERLSVAGAAEAAVRTMNQQELHGFENKAQVDRRELWNTLTWEARQLQWASQQVLNKLQMPGFVGGNITAGTTVDDSQVQEQARVCSYLHSAFFLRKRIGDKAHNTMLQSQLERLKQYVAQGSRSRTPPPLSVPYPNLPPPPPPYGVPGMLPPPPPPPLQGMVGYPGYPPQPLQQQQPQQPSMVYSQQYPPPPNYDFNNPQQRW